MASRAMTRRPLTTEDPSAAAARSGRSRRHRHDLASIVMAAGRANVVRTLHLAAIRALVVARRREGMMRAAHVAARFRGFLLGDSHIEYSLPCWAAKAASV